MSELKDSEQQEWLIETNNVLDGWPFTMTGCNKGDYVLRAAIFFNFSPFGTTISQGRL